jgi:type II secretory pathway pseudopilin PulG
MVAVLIIGVLAAIAGALYLRRTDEAHTVEDTQHLDVLSRTAALYLQERHTIEPGTSPVSGTFPHKAQCTSTGNRLGSADVPAPDDFARGTTFHHL